MVTMESEMAGEILKKQTIRIGSMECRVRGRIAVTRCYKCLGFGHRMIDCRGPDRSDHCLNCYGTGHTAKDCKNDKYCSNCEKRGTEPIRWHVLHSEM